MRIPAVFFMLSLIALAKLTYAADCIDYKIIDHGTHVEAVCIGTPLTEAEKREIEKQQKEAQEAELRSQKMEYSQIANPPVESRPRTKYPNQSVSENVSRIEPQSEGKVVVESYDIKYIPSNKPIINGRQFPGQYSVKIDATNTGRKAMVRFKMKQVDFQGFETESIGFSEQFAKDERKTVTTHLPASAVPFIQSQNWIIEAYK